MKRHVLTLASLLSLIMPGALAVSPAVVTPEPTPAVPNAIEQQPATTKDESGPPSIFDDGQTVQKEKASLFVLIRTPHNKSATDTFTLYPYPPKPPQATKPNPLPTAEKSLKNMLVSIGYDYRPNLDKPYQLGGWRWIYCYQAAVRKSGMTPPKTMISFYQWADEMVPWAGRETKVRNAFEEERWARFQKAGEFWEKNHVDMEADAVRQGLTPIQLYHRDWSIGKTQFAPGTWWLQATRKTPGLTYYWLQPVTAAAGEDVKLTLNENNALYIKGGW